MSELEISLEFISRIVEDKDTLLSWAEVFKNTIKEYSSGQFSYRFVCRKNSEDLVILAVPSWEYLIDFEHLSSRKGALVTDYKKIQFIHSENRCFYCEKSLNDSLSRIDDSLKQKGKSVISQWMLERKSCPDSPPFFRKMEDSLMIEF